MSKYNPVKNTTTSVAATPITDTGGPELSERKILVDLIAQLREFHQVANDGPMTLTNYNYCRCGTREFHVYEDGSRAYGPAKYPCAQARALDRAEQLLKGLDDDSDI